MKISMKEKQINRRREQTVVAQGGGDAGGRDWQFGISRHKLLYIRQINDKVLLYIPRNYVQYPVIDHMERNMKKMYITEPLCYTAEMNTTL